MAHTDQRPALASGSAGRSGARTWHHWHGRATTLATALSTLSIAAMTLAYSAEVVARYVFKAPLNWSGDVSSYLLLCCVFLALPEVTRSGQHVAVSFVEDRLHDERVRSRYSGLLARGTGLALVVMVVFVALEGLRQYDAHILTSQSTQIPKWLLSCVASLGLASAALHLLLPDPSHAEGDDPTPGKRN